MYFLTKSKVLKELIWVLINLQANDDEKNKIKEKLSMYSSLRVIESGNMYNQIPKKFRKSLMNADKEELHDKQIPKKNINKKMEMNLFGKSSLSKSQNNLSNSYSQKNIDEDENPAQEPQDTSFEIDNKDVRQFNSNSLNLLNDFKTFISEKNIIDTSIKNDFEDFKSYFESYKNNPESDKMIFENLSFIENMILNKSQNQQKESELIQEVI